MMGHHQQHARSPGNSGGSWSLIGPIEVRWLTFRSSVSYCYLKTNRARLKLMRAQDCVYGRHEFAQSHH
jgi:hypothetical protein